MKMKAQVGDYILCSVRGTDADWNKEPVKVEGIDGDPADLPTVGYVMADGSLIPDYEISLDDVLLESEAEEFYG